VGVAFLEETFSSRTASPRHRAHQPAARAVLKALLPEQGTDIRGHMRSHAQLLEASGYARRPRDFEDLLRVLDGEVRLITPAEPGGAGSEAGEGRAGPGERYYQLTHDYLVHSLREWLTRTQKATRRGRAELRLAECAALWNGRPENRYLPAWWEWASIRLLARRSDWTPVQRRLMRRANAYYALRGTLLIIALALLALGGWWTFGALRARSLVESLLTAKTAEVPDLIRDLGPYRRWADSLLRERASEEGLDEDRRLHIALALLPADGGQAPYLGDRLLAARGPEDVAVIRELLHEHAPDSAPRFWAVLEDESESKARRLRAACALALFDADDPRWAKVAGEVARCLAGENIVSLGEWAGQVKPLRGHLVQHLVRRLVEANAIDFPAFLALLSAYADDAVAEFQGLLRRTLPPAASTQENQALAQQQAQAAAALLQLGRGELVWPLFRQGADPTGRTYLLHRCAALGVDPALLASRLAGGEEKDPSARQGLVLALGEYSAEQRAEVVRGPLVDRVLTDYRDDADPGVHSAAEWTLRRWYPGFRKISMERLRRLVNGPEMDRAFVRKLIDDDAEWQIMERFARIDQELVRAGATRLAGEVNRPCWYVNGQGQTFVVIPAPGPFEIGSPEDERRKFTGEDRQTSAVVVVGQARADEKGTSDGEERRRVRIDYPFAVATKLVTVAEFKKFWPEFQYPRQWSPGADTPINGVTWYDAVAYCNWLSAQEGLPRDQWCYVPVRDTERASKDGGTLNLAANWLQRTGYRLPTEREWEYACRSGTVTAWSQGADQEMLPRYAWFSLNANGTMRPVGALKPNGLGLFDMHGNTWEWCQDAFEGQASNEVTMDIGRVVRGGSFNLDAKYARSAYRNWLEPANRLHFTGFRVARTSGDATSKGAGR
jgi:formylglycine-generating enzyme required for sulfatase activity